MKVYLYVILLLGSAVCSSAASTGLELVDDTAFYNISDRAEVLGTYCTYPPRTTILNNPYDFTNFYRSGLSPNTFCYTSVLSRLGSYQRYSCRIQLNYRSQFWILSRNMKIYARYYCNFWSCSETAFTLNVPTNFVYTSFLAGPNGSGSIRCTAQTIPTRPPGLQQASYCKCGQPSTARIVGGQNAGFGEYPFMAQLLYRGNTRSFCGGSLISNMFVLTAAHCTSGLQASDISVGLGVTVAGDFSTGRRVQVSQIIDHPDYKNVVEGADISLLRLSQSVEFRSSSANSIRPVCLPTGSSTYAGVSAVAIGWGKLIEGGSSPLRLQEVTVPVYSNTGCANTYGSAIKPDMICAGGRQSQGICKGDSGGPLLYRNSAGFYDTIGISSFGRGCARLNNPAVFARVTYYINWINSVARGTITCSRP